MFHTMRESISARMKELEQIDARDRMDGTPKERRLRQVPQETGRFLALLAASAPEGSYLEIGSSGGYSTLWLALAGEATGRKITTFEISADKARLARETFRLAGVDEMVELVQGDAREHLPHYERISFCFLDAEKEIYAQCYEMVVARLTRGGFLVADNAISHREELSAVLERAFTDVRVDALIVPIGKGLLVCRKV